MSFIPKNTSSVRFVLPLTLILFLLGFALPCVFAQDLDDEWLLNSNRIQGNHTPELRSILNNVKVQLLLINIAKEPRSENYMSNSLKETDISLDQLLNNKLVQKQGDVYSISYLLFTSDDMYRMREITDSHAKKLAQSLLDHREEFEQTVKEYDLESVDPRAVLYIVLGCFLLDWEGLAISAERDLRLNDPDDTRTIVYSWEPTDLSKEGFYKGSHNVTIDTIRLTSFGDHEIQPREALPDILWRLPRNSKDKMYSDTLNTLLKPAVGVYAEHMGIDLGQIILSLRDGEKSLDDLMQVTDTNPENAEALLNLLEGIHYISKSGDKYRAIVPVLSLKDSTMIKRIFDIGQKELLKWFNSDYKRLYDELSELTPFRNGVAQKDFFYEVWHDIFGAANLILSREGLYANPYSELYGARGIIPIVYDNRLGYSM
jgi:hypothetical protein